MLTLKDYQIESIDFAYRNPYSICCLEMGLGKSVVSLEVFKLVGGYALIVCPAFLKENWKNELKKWGVTNCDIVSYSSLRKTNNLNKYNMVIADEAHYLKNHNAQRTKKFHELIIKSTNVTHMMLLTGTPIANRVPEFWSLLQLCHYGGEYDEFTEFNRRYYKFCNTFAHERTFEVNNIPIVRFEGVKNPEKLKALIAPVFMRKKAKDVLDLPESVYISIKGKKTPRQLEKSLMAAFEKFEQDPNDAAYMSLKRANAYSKVSTTISFAKGMIDQGEKLVIYSDHVDSCKEIARTLEVEPIHGGIHPDVRGRMVTEFEQGETSVIVATLGSLSTGVNLVSAHRMIFNDIPFVPATLDQAKARIKRIGQDNKCFYYFVSCSEFDDKLLGMINRKNKDIGKIL